MGKTLSRTRTEKEVNTFLVRDVPTLMRLPECLTARHSRVLQRRKEAKFDPPVDYDEAIRRFETEGEEKYAVSMAVSKVF